MSLDDQIDCHVRVLLGQTKYNCGSTYIFIAPAIVVIELCSYLSKVVHPIALL